MKLLVTGGAGFIGSHVAAAYLARGHQVVIVDNLSSGKRENLPAGARFVQLDIRDRAGIDALFASERFDLVNHHAAQIDVRKSVADPRHDAECNALGLLNLLESGRAHGIRKFIFISSGGVIYGEPEKLPVAETAPKSPLSPYGVTKLIGEHYLHCYRHAHGLQYVALRYGNVYGPRQDPHGEAGVVAIFSNALLEGKTPTIFGDGEQTRDYVFIEDVVQANVLASEKLEALNASAGPELDSLGFNIGTGKETSVNELYQALAGFAKHPHPAQTAPARLGELRRIALEVGKAKRLLGFAPRWSLRDGLQKTFEWVRGSKNR